jgi:DNA-binding PadR family transcriptional regulator
MTENNNIQAFLPLTEVTFFILLSLSPAPKHGYAIAKDIQALSNSRVNLSTSTLYTGLKRLLEENWIERSEEHSTEVESGRLRKIYSLSKLGQDILDAEIKRLQSLLTSAQLRSIGEKS